MSSGGNENGRRWISCAWSQISGVKSEGPKEVGVGERDRKEGGVKGQQRVKGLGGREGEPHRW